MKLCDQFKLGELEISRQYVVHRNVRMNDVESVSARTASSD